MPEQPPAALPPVLGSVPAYQLALTAVPPFGRPAKTQRARSTRRAVLKANRPRRVASMATSKSTALPFSAATAESVLVTACEIAGLDARGARLLRLGENALFHLPVESAVVRIARTMDYWRDVVKEVAVARWLANYQFPAAEVCEIPQPIQVADHPVTFWRFISGRRGGREDIVHLGALLRRLHRLPRPVVFDLPEEDILGRKHSGLPYGRLIWMSIRCRACALD